MVAEHIDMERNMTDVLHPAKGGHGTAIVLGSAMAVLMAFTPALAVETVKPPQSETAFADDSIRPFEVHVDQAQIDDLKARIRNARWPDKETVGDIFPGHPAGAGSGSRPILGSDYDWRNAEKELNALPQFITRIDGVDIHFIHVRSRHPNALLSSSPTAAGFSLREFTKVIGPLTDPTAYGGKAEDAFDVIIPIHPRLWFFRPSDRSGLGTGPCCAGLGRPCEAPRLHTIRFPGRRSWFGHFRCACPAGAKGSCSASISICRPPFRRAHERHQQR